MANRTVRTNIEMEKGLKSFVADLIMARHNSNRKLARELKLTIDKIIFLVTEGCETHIFGSLG